MSRAPTQCRGRTGETINAVGSKRLIGVHDKLRLRALACTGLFAALLLAAACVSKPVPQSASGGKPVKAPMELSPSGSIPAEKPAVGDFGLDLSAMDPSVKAGDDFYGYANGRWYRS